MDGAEVPAGPECTYWDHLGEEGAVRLVRWDVRGKVVRTTKSNPSNFSPIRSRKRQIGICT